MAVVTNIYNLNLIPGISAPVTVHCSQGDSGREISFRILSGTDVYNIPSGARVSIHGVRKDNGHYGPIACTFSGSTVTFTLTAEMTSVKGGGLAELEISSDGVVVGSTNFAVLVEKATFPTGVTYDNDVSVYQDILTYVMSSVIPTEAVTIDNTLSITGAAADAKKTGDEIGELKSELISGIGAEPIEFILGAYINTNTDIIDPTPVTSIYWDYAIMPCTEGDVFVVNSHGQTSQRGWAFCESDYTRISYSLANFEGDNTVLVAPEGAAYLILNDLKSKKDAPSWKGYTAAVTTDMISKIDSDVYDRTEGYSFDSDQMTVGNLDVNGSISAYYYSIITTDYFEVNEGTCKAVYPEKYTIDGTDYTVKLMVIGFTDRSPANPVVIYSAYSTYKQFVVPSGVKYVRISYAIGPDNVLHAIDVYQDGDLNITLPSVIEKLAWEDNDYLRAPANDGTSGQFLMTDGNGNTSWGTPPDTGITADEYGLLFNSQPYLSSLDWHAQMVAFSGLFADVEKFESFVFFTDPHLRPTQLALDSSALPTYELKCNQFINTLQKMYNSIPAEFIMCGGDWLNSPSAESRACGELGYVQGFMQHMFHDYHCAVGNHDTNFNSSDSSTLSNQTINNLWYTEEEQGLSYYSFNGNNCKYYVLDTWTENAAQYATQYVWDQLKWIAQKLNTDDPEHATVFMHIIIQNGTSRAAAKLAEILAAYNAHGTATITNPGLPNDPITVDFTGTTGKVDFVMGGHTHYDDIRTLEGIPFITTTTFGAPTATKPTFDMVFVDYDNDVVHCVRVGDGESRTVNI